MELQVGSETTIENKCENKEHGYSLNMEKIRYLREKDERANM